MKNLNEKVLEVLKMNANYNSLNRTDIIEKYQFEELAILIADLCQSIGIIKQTSKEVFLAARMTNSGNSHYINQEDLNNVSLKYSNLEHFLAEKAKAKKENKRLIKF